LQASCSSGFSDPGALVERVDTGAGVERVERVDTGAGVERVERVERVGTSAGVAEGRRDRGDGRASGGHMD
jgi:hypothetical protein